MDKKNSTLADVYSGIIEKTVNSLKIHLESIQKKPLKFDIADELKKRWKLRVDLLIESMNGSWSKFQDSCLEKKGFNEIKETPQNFIGNFCLPSICSLSWDLYRYYRPSGSKTSNFKLWVWNCMISGKINNGNYFPVSSFLFFKKASSPLKSCSRSKLKIYSKKTEKNIFKWTHQLRNETEKLKKLDISQFNFYKNSLKCNENSTEYIEGDFSEDTSIEDLDGPVSGKFNKNHTPNFLLAVIEKVYRRNTKWTVILKDGILNINKKDFLFNLCKCEFFW